MCPTSLPALNKIATKVLRNAKPLPPGIESQRKKLINLLLDNQYDQAERLSGTILTNEDEKYNL